MRTTDKFVFFWDGPYSQWVYAPMQIDGMTYTSCEQYMMYQKAILFGDIRIAEKILASDSPAEQKALGKKVKGFDRDVWDKHCTAIVYKANYAKFKQNPELGKELRLTNNKIIVEASPTDKIWGIAMGENDPGIEDPANWKGLNLLGSVIMNVRSVLNHELFN